jgi:hypothetical protein
VAASTHSHRPTVFTAVARPFDETDGVRPSHSGVPERPFETDDEYNTVRRGAIGGRCVGVCSPKAPARGAAASVVSPGRGGTTAEGIGVSWIARARVDLPRDPITTSTCEATNVFQECSDRITGTGVPAAQRCHHRSARPLPAVTSRLRYVVLQDGTAERDGLRFVCATEFVPGRGVRPSRSHLSVSPLRLASNHDHGDEKNAPKRGRSVVSPEPRADSPRSWRRSHRTTARCTCSRDSSTV